MTEPTDDLPDTPSADDAFTQAFSAMLDAREAGRPLDRDAVHRAFPTLSADEVDELFRLTEMMDLVGEPGANSSEPAHLVLERFGEYDVPADQFLGKGGLNSVHRVIDRRFDRPLAVKVPLAPFRNDREVCEHLKREAAICARLQHPNIVPIYELGSYRDICPFFSMKLVEGTTFLALLGARKDPTERLIYFLAIFKQACETMAYAHARGVVHRDLKPGNIMVGRFNEVHVMDWGFARTRWQWTAKATGGRHATEAAGVTLGFAVESQRQRLRHRGLHGSGAGGPIPPRITTRTDVFGLGGILTHILTGRPVYIGHARDEIWRLAREGDTADARRRLAECEADRELVQLATHALAKDPGDRPTAESLAVSIQAYLSRIENQKVQAERRAKWLTVILAAAVVSLILLSGGVWFALDRQARLAEAQLRRLEGIRQRELVATDVTRDGAEANDAIGQERFDRATAALRHARGRLADSRPTELSGRLAEADRYLAAVVNLDEIRQERAVLTADPQLNARPSLKKYAEQFRALGCDPSRPDALDRLKAASPAGPPTAGPRCGLDGPWATYERNAEDASPSARPALRPRPRSGLWRPIPRPSHRSNGKALAELAKSAPRDRLSISRVEATVNALPRDDRTALEPVHTAESHTPNDFWLNYATANRLVAARADDEAVNRSLHRDAIGYARTAAALRPRSLAALLLLAEAYEQENQPAEVAGVADRVSRLGRASWITSAILARAAKARQDPQAVITHAKQAVALAPDNDSLKLYLVGAYLAIFDVANARELIDILERDLGMIPRRCIKPCVLRAETVQRGAATSVSRSIIVLPTMNSSPRSCAVLVAAEEADQPRRLCRNMRPEQMKIVESRRLYCLIRMFRGDSESAVTGFQQIQKVRPAYLNMLFFQAICLDLARTVRRRPATGRAGQKPDRGKPGQSAPPRSDCGGLNLCRPSRRN